MYDAMQSFEKLCIMIRTLFDEFRHNRWTKQKE